VTRVSVVDPNVTTVEHADVQFSGQYKPGEYHVDNVVEEGGGPFGMHCKPGPRTTADEPSQYRFEKQEDESAAGRLKVVINGVGSAILVASDGCQY